MEKKYETITFCSEQYLVKDEATGRSEPSEYLMWEDVKNFLRIAIKNGYQCKLWFDGLTLVVEYNYMDEAMSGVSLNWLGENEYIETCTKAGESNGEE